VPKEMLPNVMVAFLSFIPVFASLNAFSGLSGNPSFEL